MPALRDARREALCQYRVFGGSDRRPMTWPAAYRAAGYRGKHENAHEQVTSRADVRARVAELIEERTRANLKNTTYDRDTVISELLENVRESKAGLVIDRGQVVYVKDPDGNLVTDEYGNPIPVRRRDARAINQALELLGAELGMFPKINKLEHSRVDPFKGLTAEEIAIELRNNLMQELGVELRIDDLFQLVNSERKRSALEIARDRQLPAGPERS